MNRKVCKTKIAEQIKKKLNVKKNYHFDKLSCFNIPNGKSLQLFLMIIRWENFFEIIQNETAIEMLKFSTLSQYYGISSFQPRHNSVSGNEVDFIYLQFSRYSKICLCDK